MQLLASLDFEDAESAIETYGLDQVLAQLVRLRKTWSADIESTARVLAGNLRHRAVTKLPSEAECSAALDWWEAPGNRERPTFRVVAAGQTITGLLAEKAEAVR